MPYFFTREATGMDDHTDCGTHGVGTLPESISARDLLIELIRRGVTLRAGRDEESPGWRTLDIWPPERARDLRNAIDAQFGELHGLAEVAAAQERKGGRR